MDIVEEIRKDPERGARLLEHEYKAGLTSLALRFCPDPADAEELVNRTFAEVVAGIDGFLEQSAFFTWMCRILVHCHAKDRRRLSRRNEIAGADAVEDAADGDADGRLLREVDAGLLRDAIAELPPDIRRTVVMHYFLDVPVREAARVLAIPVGTVAWRLHYARMLLGAKLGAAARKPAARALLAVLALAALVAAGAAAFSAFSDAAPEPPLPAPDAVLPQPSREEPMKSLHNIAAPLASLALAAMPAAADTFTWMASPADANWNASSPNWNSGTAWIDGNDAVFPDSSSEKTITLSAMRTANDVTVNGSGYSIGGALLKVDGKFTANKGTTLAAGFGGDGVRIGGPSTATVYMGWAGAPTVKTVTLEDTIVIAPNDRRCLGPDPAAPATNVVAAGPGPSLYANGNVNLGENRIVRIQPGKALFLGAATGKTLTLGNLLADPSEGLDFNTNALVRIPGYWAGAVVLAPPAGATNGIGRLTVEGNSRVAGGATNLGSPAMGATEHGALLYVNGNNSAFSATRGNLVVDGGALVASQSSRYAEVSRWGQVTVTNGGAIHMPGVEWLNGLTMPGRLVVEDGEFVVGTLRISQSGSEHGSEILIGKSGVVRVSKLRMDNTSKCLVTFDGGTFQSTRTATEDGRNLFTDNAARWANVTFAVGEGGALFDASNGINIWWDRPLESAAARDGGIRKFGNGNLILRAANTYNGPTVVESGFLNARADYAVPAGSALRLGGGDSQAIFDAYVYEGSPARPSTNRLSRVEGAGVLINCGATTVSGSVAPDAGGMLDFRNVCALSGTYEISGDASGCGCLKVAADQDISGLSLAPGDMAGMNTSADRTTYRILHAPGGYLGEFSLAADFPRDKWNVRASGTAVYLVPVKAFVVILR